ncbi:hypothetical protein AC578_4566 [Pseudocercospora eumusae]|uniref:Amino acid permease/ SLC12A domain-containing protein n=1 Tax=Pseudocercospora eumusae TaxID=321146 RepID=A0A139H4L3_9PEZI|nr:hypothetical protein AC578_4566 [Pseudocercospora eumusae]
MVSQEASQPHAAYYTGSPKYVEDDSQKTRHDEEKGGSSIDTSDAENGHQLKRELKGRHMQMIAVGGAIGAGLFVGSGSALQAGGPASLVLGFIIIGFMLLLTMQALTELAVLFPVNGAFFTYAVRFIDPSWGFATGWDYAIGWLVILPFEITAASLTIAFWDSAKSINIGVWITVFLVALSAVQIFGIRGYGEVEFVLSIIKILACTGFIILGIIINCGGVPTDHRGYIGARYWHDPGAFRHGFKGFCSVFVTASFAFGGTELTGLAAAEAKNPLKSIPQATKQVFWRIAFFYVICLFILGLNVPSDSDVLLNSHGANTKASPFVYAMVLAGIKGLPSVFNVVICLSVLSVANSSAYGSTRTMQALAAHGMGPKFLAYIDKSGRPLWCVLIQLSFGLLAFVNEATNGGPQFFNWLLALTGLANFFIWATICLSHIRFRAGWKAQGRSIEEIPYKAFFGIWGSYIGIAMNIICLIATFYVALWPVGGSPDAEDFFESYLAAPLILTMYLCWKIYTRDWKLFIRAAEMDVTTGMRHNLAELREMAEERQRSLGLASWPKRVVRALF